MSGARLTPLLPDQLDEDQRRFYDAVLDSPRAQGATRRFMVRDDGSLTGPFDAFLRSPELGVHLERLGMAFRTDTVLSPAARELAILVVAKAWHAEFEWWVHAMVAKGVGVPEAAIDAIGHGKPPDLEDASLSAAHQVAHQLVHRRALEDDALATAKAVLGERATVELVTLVGFYQLVSGVLESFQPPAPSDDLPIVGPPR